MEKLSKITDFNTFLARHGEPATQALIEKMEEWAGIDYRGVIASLEERWNSLMRDLDASAA